LLKECTRLFDGELHDIVDRLIGNFDEEALTEIVNIARKRNTGARALRAIMENTMLDIMYKLPLVPNVESCTVTKETVSGKADPLLTFKKSKKTA
jgi:ATP-dependent Clp protease ATP-binding subunit ClpX